MSALFSAITRAFPRELISHLAARLGEGENGMKRALQGVLPVMMGGMARKAEASDAQLLFEWSNRAYLTTPYGLGSVTGMLGILGGGQEAGSAMMQGETLLLVLFGNSWQTIAASVSRYAQVKRTTASTLLMLVGAVLPGLLGQYAERNRLSAAAVTANLISIKNRLNNLLPGDLRAVADALGLTATTQPAKGRTRQGQVISWSLMLAVLLGMSSARVGLLAHVLPVGSAQLVHGWCLMAAQVAGGMTRATPAVW
ncbi:DUF937 domain-containing protein [Microvirga sp. STS02]|uniref:DUF937 domain-containing protein n=1 Tax=Hymenobacter negativus TaxID=2795026 RepID=UPI0018DC9D4D|nr:MULTISPECIES: DUF937 domain-containing protein [Bacteria]MBH8571220.1 DUF937 domain-containing protein [Hymenobacter negativus]MBR7210957.1 DUF937 domain-containing protein [Microvirga sp. STS02]